MPQQESNLGLYYGWAAGESGWNEQNDANLRAIGALVQLTVVSMSETAPPGAAADGDRYIVPSGGTGAWTGQDGLIAVWREAVDAWQIYSPKEGWDAWVLSIGQRVMFDGTNWLLPGDLYGRYADDTAAATGGVPVGGFYVNSSTGALSVRLS